jgi:hypothetical protein
MENRGHMRELGILGRAFAFLNLLQRPGRYAERGGNCFARTWISLTAASIRSPISFSRSSGIVADFLSLGSIIIG